MLIYINQANHDGMGNKYNLENNLYKWESTISDKSIAEIDYGINDDEDLEGRRTTHGCTRT